MHPPATPLARFPRPAGPPRRSGSGVRGSCGRLAWTGCIGILAVTMASGCGPLPPRPEQPDAGKRPGAAEAPGPVMIACAASNQGVMELIIADYRRVSGREVVASYGPSQSLLAGIEIAAAADLFLPADESYVTLARERGLVREEPFPLGEMQAVVAVRRGNPRAVRTAADLLDPGLRVALADPETAAIGGLTRRLLEPGNLWRPLAAKATVFTASVTEVAGAVTLGAVDAGVVYDVVLRDFPDLEAVEIPEFAGGRSRVVLAVVATTRRPAGARDFARFVASPEHGLARYRDRGFHAVRPPVSARSP